MSLYHQFTPVEKPPASPDHFAHEPNEIAVRAADVAISRREFEQEISKLLEQDNYRKVVNVSQSIIMISGILTLAFVGVVCWEWEISQEIYSVLMPGAPLFPYLVCLAVGFFASICFAETVPYFQVLPVREGTATEDAVTGVIIGKLYDCPKQRGTSRQGWFVHPLTGVFSAAVLLVGIYLISQERVAFLAAAGEAPESNINVFVPTILYALEILFGIPAFFFTLWLSCWWRTRRQRQQFSQLRDYEIKFRDAAVRGYTNYLSHLEEYNAWAERNEKPARPLVPPNRELRDLLVASGFDAFAREGEPVKRNGRDGYDSGAPASDTVGIPSTDDPSAAQPVESGARVDDLMRLVDEQIHRENSDIQ